MPGQLYAGSYSGPHRGISQRGRRERDFPSCRVAGSTDDVPRRQCLGRPARLVIARSFDHDDSRRKIISRSEDTDVGLQCCGVRFALRVSLAMSAFGPKQTGRKTQSTSLLGVKRTCRVAPHMSAFDPKRTWAGHFRRGDRMTYDGNKMILPQPH